MRTVRNAACTVASTVVLGIALALLPNPDCRAAQADDEFLDAAAKLVEWPDSPRGVAVAAPPVPPPAAKTEPKEYVVATHVGRGDPYFKAAERIAAHRKAPVLEFDPSDLGPLMLEISALKPRFVCVVAKPEVIDTNFIRRFLMACAGVDSDPFPDFSYGYITGEDGAAALRFVENIIRAEKSGLPRRFMSTFVTTHCSSEKDKGPSWLKAAGFSTDSMGFGYEDRKAAMDFVRTRLADLQGRGLIQMTGCGDPERIWLFSDSRNSDASKHWKYNPAKVGQNPRNEMFWIDADMVRRLNLYPAVLTTGTCHCGSPDRVFVEGDIVSTFGTSDKVEVYRIPRGRSLCLAYISAGVTAAMLPVGPNHGWRTSVEVLRMFRTGAPMGEVMKSCYDELVLAYAGAIKLGLYDSEGHDADEGINEVMRGGAANRVLYGDPAFAPFAKIDSLASPVVRTAGSVDGSLAVDAEVVKSRDYGELFGAECVDQFTSFRSKLLFEAILPAERFPHGVARVEPAGSASEGAMAMVSEIRWAVESAAEGLVLHAGAFSGKDAFEGGLGSVAGQRIGIKVVPARTAAEASTAGTVKVNETAGLVDKALATPWQYEWKEWKLGAVLDFISGFLEKHGGGASAVKFEFDESALPCKDRIVTLKLSSETLRAGLDRLAKELNLAYSVDSAKNTVRFSAAK